MASKLDRTRAYSEITGTNRTHSFEQDNKCFDAGGDEISKADMLDRLQAAVPAGSDAQVGELRGLLDAANRRADEIMKERDNLKNLLESATQSDNTARMADLEAQIRQKDGEIATANETITKQQQELDQSFDALKAVADKQATKTEVTPTSVPSTEPTVTPADIPSASPATEAPTSPSTDNGVEMTPKLDTGATEVGGDIPAQPPIEVTSTGETPPADIPAATEPTP